MDTDIPDMCGLADVKRSCDTGNPPFADPTDMVGIDLQTHAIVLLSIDHQRGGHASQRLCQRDGGATMEQPIGLTCPVIDRHACLQIVIPDFGEFDADMFHHGLMGQWPNLFRRYGRVEPDGHQRVVCRLDNERATTSGRNCITSPPFFNTSRTSVEATEVYCGRQVRKMVSIS